MSIILTVFALVFLGEFITWIGQSVLLELGYSLFLRIFYPTLATQQKQLKSELLSKKAELMKTSAQDQFAKWAKLRRSVDKGMAELEKINSQLASTRSAFSMKFNTAIWLLTTGLQFLVGFWYRKAPIFYLPPGWFGPLGWILALPFAPSGSVSVGMWQMTCRRVIKVGERVVKDFASPSPKEVEPQPAKTTPEKDSKNRDS